MRYAAARMAELLACPFCREMFPRGEAGVCPSCGLKLEEMSKLGPSYDAVIEADWPEKPEYEPLGFWYWRRGRLALAAAAALGLAAFFLPWIHETTPEILTLTGFQLARRLGWLWACAVSWGVLIPTVLSRQSVARMRGARVAAALFCAIPLVSALVLLATPPAPPPNLRYPFAFHFGAGLWATIAVSLLSLPFAVRFGGKTDDLPMARGTSAGEVVN